MDVVPIFRPAISEAEIEAVTSVLRSGWIGPGPQVQQFEVAFATAVGAPFAISTCNGTGALAAALAMLGVGPGDEVILPSFTWPSLFQVLLSLGATPVFADVEPVYLTLDPEDVARRITPRTKGIVTVHHGGQLSDLDGLLHLTQHTGLWLIDDAAHASGASYHGRPVGTQCIMTCFSFNAVKNLTAGDGGMVTTADQELAQKLAMFRSLGLEHDTWARYGRGVSQTNNRWFYQVMGYGQRLHMNDILAALACVQLQRLPALNQRRTVLVQRYEEAFAAMAAWRSIKARPDTSPSWHMYTVLMDKRDAFIERMRERGITVGVHYYPTHLYPLAKPYATRLPVTEEVWQRVTTFPLYPTMTEEEQEQVIVAALQLAPQ